MKATTAMQETDPNVLEPENVKAFVKWSKTFRTKEKARKCLGVSKMTYDKLLLKAKNLKEEFTAHPDTIAKIREKIGVAA